MKNYKNLWQKIVPVLVAVALFGVVSIVGFAPQIKGKVLPQHDIEQFDGMSRDIRECRTEFDEDPQWTGAMFSGMPAYQINIKYPTQILKRTTDWLLSLFAAPASLIFFAMLAAFGAAILMGMSAWVGIIVGLAYGLSTYFFLIIGAGHITKMWALVYAPLFLASVHFTLRRNMWLGGALTALFASLEVGANHPQITYYFTLAIAALWISDLVFALREKRGKDFAKRTAILGGAAILAFGASFSPLYYTMQHTSDTVRGGSALEAEGERKGLDIEYATAWSYGVDESANLLVPNFMGGSSADTFSKGGTVDKALRPLGLSGVASQLPTYWGEQPYTAGPTYLGAVAIFLALLGLLLAEAKDRWWVVAAGVLSLLMSWGYHAMWFTELCFNILPLYNKFRAVSTALVVVEWCVPLLAGMALWQIYKQWGDKKRLTRAVAIAAGVVAGISLILAVGGESLYDFGRERDGEMMSEQYRYMLGGMEGGEEYIARGMHAELGWQTADAMAEERAEILAKDAWRSLLFVVVVALVIIAAIRLDGRWRGVALAVLAVMIVVDMLPVNLRYQPHERFVEKRTTKVRPTEADKQIMADKELGYRVLNLSVSPFNDATTSMFHRSIGGYHGAKMGRYQDLIDHYLLKLDEGVLDMLNTKYIITQQGEVVERTTANGAAWFVQNIDIVAGADAELAALSEVNLKTTAVAEEGAPRPQIEGSGVIELKEYRPNRLVYYYKLTGGTGVAVFSEIYYDKGWQAYLDGEPCDSFRADYLLRAMVLPEGTHTVEWRFKAPNWGFASTITLICSILIIFALVITTIYSCYGFRTKKNIE